MHNRIFSRREFVSSSLIMAGAAAVFPAAVVGIISPEEKKLLKQQLQRELERKVYNVQDELFQGVNRAKNSKKLEGHETSHVPKIVTPSTVKKMEPFTVHVEVGIEELHEMNPFHYIDWISVYANGLLINQAVLTPFYNRPIISFSWTLERAVTIKAVEHCNLHGSWEAEAKISVM